MESPKLDSSNKGKKRGRPPIDDYDSSSTSYPPPKLHAKIVSVTTNVEESASNDAMSSSDHDMSIWEEDQPNDAEVEADENSDDIDKQLPIKIKSEVRIIFTYLSFHVLQNMFHI